MSLPLTETYRDQLLRLTRALAAAKGDEIVADISADSKPLGVKMFVDGNLDKRFDKLMNGLEFIAPAFKDFDDLVVAYVKSLSLAAYDTGASDSERLLVWLEETRKLTARQRDYIACQRARHEVEQLARENRLAYVRFLERLSVTQAFVEHLPHTDASIYLNPILAWATFRTRALLGSEAEPPCRVVFFPVDGEINTAALDERGQALLGELAELGPVNFASWAVLTQHADGDDLLETVQDLAAMGLAAVA